jgi:hypothetical protein
MNSRDLNVQAAEARILDKMVQALDNLTHPFFAGKTAIEVGNPWSNQDVAVWYENCDGSWSIIRSGFSLWNYLGTLATAIRMQPGYYLFPKGFVPA